jgi:hypothetical protein
MTGFDNLSNLTDKPSRIVFVLMQVFQPILALEEAGEKHRPWASNW